MYKGYTFLAVIPARGGSKGIPHKNIALLNGRPLIDYTVCAAKESNYIDGIVVSTDDDEIAKVSKLCGTEVLMRPAELAKDDSKTIDAVMHVITNYKEFDYIVLLQPTQPLREAKHIDEAIEQMIDEKSNSLVAISPVKDHPILIRKYDESTHEVQRLLEQTSTVRRQDFERYYVVNGAIYINKTDMIHKETSFNDNETGYIMDSKYDIDIDEPIDLAICEEYMKRMR